MFSNKISRVLGIVAFSSLFALTATANDRHHSRNISMRGSEPAATCNDLRIEFDDRAAVIQAEERTITKAEAPVLRATGESNGGVQVVGWDKDTYSVSLCKAVAPGSESLLSQIKFTGSNGEIGVSGPSHADDWIAFLLIHAPKSAALDLRVNNGPLSVYSVEGRVSAHATNGPISARDCNGELKLRAQNGPVTATGSTGNLDLQTENGPISADASGGSVNIRTQNGPIDLTLAGQTWNGAGLQAHADNGPLTIHVPSGYKSGVVIESDGRSPFSCNDCSEGRKTWDNDKKKIEFGSGPTLVHVSTVNGPISVN
ncbi:MAG: DUF4097 family beta strand repeat protein [Acidobacteria bacterium]|nr:DUF4097 family beta strand repeat protein [Acidobacteriota bacterium]MBS1865209.1 DUF4097 family beta strand repeat protein [Acidobacteriota bacterium]